MMSHCFATKQSIIRNGIFAGCSALCIPHPHICPRYCLSHMADLKFHIPWLSNDTIVAVQEFGYTYTFICNHIHIRCLIRERVNTLEKSININHEGSFIKHSGQH